MRVALVQPPPRSEFDRHWARFPGLGIAYVASSLRAAGHEVELLDGKLDGLGERVEVLADRILIGTNDGDATAHAVHERGVPVESVLVRRSTLEDVFLTLTGRTLVD